ncbi:MAG TPA: hypothetical protein VFR06_04495 [Gallionellaceae bacterium]|nr:hypothetical protein [Gallionellaceae bacterium]
MSSAKAWLLDFGAVHKAAVGTRELLHLIDAPVTFDVPLAPAYCHQVVMWQERLLPVLDMSMRVGGAAQSGAFLAVVGYQQRRGEFPLFGALRLSAPPRQLSVGDDQACALPETFATWQPWVVSCFEQQGQAIPILNLGRLFETPPAE